MDKYIFFYETNTILNTIAIAGTNNYITNIFFESEIRHLDNNFIIKETKIIKKCWLQINEYLTGKRKKFDIPISLEGTPFQKSVWEELQHIPYGKTATYKEIAININNPKGYRAVGLANNKNKIPIIIPCHRVIGSNNKLIGYAGGVNIKEFLLLLEKSG